MDKGPFLIDAARKYIAEQFLGLLPIEKVVLIRRPFIGIAWRDRDPDAEFLRKVEEGRDIGGRMPIVDRGIHVDYKAFGLGGLDRGYGALEDAFLAHRLVVVLFQSVKMHGNEQVR